MGLPGEEPPFADENIGVMYIPPPELFPTFLSSDPFHLRAAVFIEHYMRKGV